MKLWGRLYSVIWLAFFGCMLVPRWMGNRLGTPIHGLLGLVLVVLVLGNAKRLTEMSVPDRLKRISKATGVISIALLASGAALVALRFVPTDWPMAAGVLQVVHVVCALAILAQASSVATAYDMWEEKEFQAPSQASQRTS